MVVVGTAPEVRPRPGVVRAAAGAETTVPGASKAMRRRACCVVGDSEAVNMSATRKAGDEEGGEGGVGTKLSYRAKIATEVVMNKRPDITNTLASISNPRPSDSEDARGHERRGSLLE